MKTKKVIICVLITLFVFSPVLNLEIGAALRTATTVKILKACEPEPVDTIIPVCFPLGNAICCERYICYGGDLSNCDLLDPMPLCSGGTPAK
jgi:hypothetical protein